MTDVDERAGTLPEMVPEPMTTIRPRRWRRRASALAWVVSPWLWFVVRDLDARFDYLAMVLPLVVGLALWAVSVVGAVALWTKRRHVRWVTVTLFSWLVFGLVAMFGPRYPQPTGRPTNPIRILSANVARDTAGVVEALEADKNVELLVLSEPGTLSPALRKRFPYVRQNSSVVVASAYPLAVALDTNDGLFRRARGMRLTVQRPGTPFVLYAVHLPKAGADLAPWKRVVDGAHVEFATDGTLTAAAHRQLAADLAELAARESLPAVLAGDLNSPDRAGDYRALAAGRVDAMRDGWAGGTSIRTMLIRSLSLRIDHILIPKNWCADDATRVRLPGSDHSGIVATIGVCAG